MAEVFGFLLVIGLCTAPAALVVWLNKGRD
jgi:hypothetical protein